MSGDLIAQARALADERPFVKTRSGCPCVSQNDLVVEWREKAAATLRALADALDAERAERARLEPYVPAFRREEARADKLGERIDAAEAARDEALARVAVLTTILARLVAWDDAPDERDGWINDFAVLDAITQDARAALTTGGANNE